MADTIVHRGPDDYGYYWGQRAGVPSQNLNFDAAASRGDESTAVRVAFAHRRLSILDLSVAARQPMVLDGGEVFLTYNGEIYNFKELRTELESAGFSFKTHSDTEVVLKAYQKWGIACVSRFRGIFAFAIADLREGKVFCVRDPLGVKPLYLQKRENGWAFGSELKVFSAISADSFEPDFVALRKYLRFLWIPGRESGVSGVRKMDPGSWVEISLTTGEIREHTYWSVLDSATHGYVSDSTRVDRVATLEQQLSEFRSELERSVTEEMMSDVPFGAFLSGGLDSSLITALMSRSKLRGQQAIQTYSIGYAAKDLAYDIVPDDLPFARQASAFLGTENTEWVLSPKVAELLPKVVWHLDEPIGDPAAISSFLICQAAKKKLTVMLSGMGGDELFGGYPRQRALMLGIHFRRFPKLARRLAHALGAGLPGAGSGFSAKLGRAAKKFLASAEADPFSHYVSMETYFDTELQASVLAAGGPLAMANDPVESEYEILRSKIEKAVGSDPLKQAIALDLLTYLPSLNLAYTDRTSMANGIEVRVPLLDVRLVEWALQRDSESLLRFERGRYHGKWLLKKAAEPYLPPEIIWRKKAGFGAPVRSWLRGDLKEMSSELLGARGLAGRGWFESAGIKKLESDFAAGRRDYSLHLWMLISLELWTRAYIDRRVGNANL